MEGSTSGAKSFLANKCWIANFKACLNLHNVKMANEAVNINSEAATDDTEKPNKIIIQGGPASEIQ